MIKNIIRSAAILGLSGIAIFWAVRIFSPGVVASLESEPMVNLKNIEKVFEEKKQKVDGVQLTGIFLDPSNESFASFITKNGPVAVELGEMVMPGVWLTKIEADHVMVGGRGSGQIRIDLLK